MWMPKIRMVPVTEDSGPAVLKTADGKLVKLQYCVEAPDQHEQWRNPFNERAHMIQTPWVDVELEG